MRCLPETARSSLGTRKEKERMLSVGHAKNFNMRLRCGKTKGEKQKKTCWKVESNAMLLICGMLCHMLNTQLYEPDVKSLVIKIDMIVYLVAVVPPKSWS